MPLQLCTLSVWRDDEFASISPFELSLRLIEHPQCDVTKKFADAAKIKSESVEYLWSRHTQNPFREVNCVVIGIFRQ